MLIPKRDDDPSELFLPFTDPSQGLFSTLFSICSLSLYFLFFIFHLWACGWIWVNVGIRWSHQLPLGFLLLISLLGCLVFPYSSVSWYFSGWIWSLNTFFGGLSFRHFCFDLFSHWWKSGYILMIVGRWENGKMTHKHISRLDSALGFGVGGGRLDEGCTKPLL